MELINIGDMKETELAKVIKKVPIITDQLIASVYFISPDRTLPRHTHTDIDEIHYIVDGNGRITIDGTSRNISKGLLILVPKGSSHFFSASKNGMTLISLCPIIRNRKMKTGYNKTSRKEGE
ncbi:MAG: cupin domain-containing protein [Candidatus Thermoplasmatota archaeon]|jgi:quercetin dioxygenase-like cupin family protein|nr:cupin domain-containing protein [Candidatus Thermoplasmatota archaeon]MDP7264402.1 cupin domain-containing protein [Candidatus Thermoplasmatota archaeon]